MTVLGTPAIIAPAFSVAAASPLPAVTLTALDAIPPSYAAGPRRRRQVVFVAHREKISLVVIF